MSSQRCLISGFSVISVPLCLCGSILLSGCAIKEPKARPSEIERLPRVEVVTPLRTNIERRIEISATIEPMEQAVLSARVPGVVDYMPDDIDIGRVVKGPHDGMPGEKLLTLAVPDLEAQKRYKEALLEQAKRQKAQAEEARAVGEREVVEAEKVEKRYAAEYDFAKFQHERVVQLAKTNVIQPERVQETEKQRDSAQAALHAAQAQIETRKSKLKALEADIETAKSKIQVAEADLANTIVLINFATITAPFDGVITKRWVDRGATTFVTTTKDPGAPLLTIMRTDTVRVLLDIPEKDVPLVNALEERPNPDNDGDPVTLRISALSDVVPNGEFSARIKRMAQALDPNTRTMRAEVHLKNPEGHLRPGMFGRAIILLEKRYNVLTLPASALVRRAGRAEVYYVANRSGEPERGTIQRAEVELGLDDGQIVEIKLRPGSGLNGDELILAKGNGVVRVGDQVVPVPVKSE
jgi:RND family efflux transporter MFP subunit